MKAPKVRAALGFEMNATVAALIIQPSSGRYLTSKAKGDYTEPRFILPADAESYERMVEQGQKDASKYAENFAPKEGLLCHIKRAAYESGFRDGCLTQLRAIGIAPRTGRGRKGRR